MALNDRIYSFDANLVLADGANPMTVSGFTLNGGTAQFLDLGGNQGANPKQQARIDAVCVVDISALGIAAGQVAKLYVVGSNDPALAAGNVILGASEAGIGAALDIPNGATPLLPPYPPPPAAQVPAIPGRIEILFCTNWLGQLYEYVGLYVVIGGTGTIQFKAFVAVLPIG